MGPVKVLGTLPIVVWFRDGEANTPVPVEVHSHMGCGGHPRVIPVVVVISFFVTVTMIQILTMHSRFTLQTKELVVTLIPIWVHNGHEPQLTIRHEGLGRRVVPAQPQL